MDGREGVEVGMVDERVKSGRGNREGRDFDRGRGRRKNSPGRGKMEGKVAEVV